MAEFLRFSKLVITSPSRNYEVVFQPGVNIISGPISTGKSTILKLLDYACGAKTPPAYPEIAKCSEILVECNISDEIITIRRSLKSETAKSYVYNGNLDDVLNNRITGEEVSSRHVKGNKSVSSEVLTRIGWGEIEIKTSPTKESSDTNVFSLRDLAHLFYVDQDRVSADKAFYEDNFMTAIKWKEGVEIAHGLHDSDAVAISESIKQTEEEVARVEGYLLNARQFLNRMKIPGIDILTKRITKLDAEQVELQQRLSDIRTSTESIMSENYELVKRREQLDVERTNMRAKTRELTRLLAQLGRLRVQYERERNQLEFLQESEHILGQLPVIRCPACLQSTPLNDKVDICHVCNRALTVKSEGISVESRLRSTARKIVDIDKYMKELDDTLSAYQADIEAKAVSITQLDEALLRVRQDKVLPENEKILDLNQSISLTIRDKQQANEYLEFRKRAEGEGSNLAQMQVRLERLRQEQKDINEGRKSPDEVVAKLTEIYSAILREIRFPDLRETYIDGKTYKPFVRGSIYTTLSSKGAISLTVTAWHLAILIYSIEMRSLFPRLLLIDSPLSHVGQDSNDQQFRDQRIVDAFYSMLARIHNKHSAEMQIILVHNRPPTTASAMVSTSFTGDVNEGRYGLIDDEHPPEADSVDESR